jgi:hypothetical protein
MLYLFISKPSFFLLFLFIFFISLMILVLLQNIVPLIFLFFIYFFMFKSAILVPVVSLLRSVRSSVVAVSILLHFKIVLLFLMLTAIDITFFIAAHSTAAH